LSCSHKHLWNLMSVSLPSTLTTAIQLSVIKQNRNKKELPPENIPNYSRNDFSEIILPLCFSNCLACQILKLQPYTTNIVGQTYKRLPVSKQFTPAQLTITFFHQQYLTHNNGVEIFFYSHFIFWKLIISWELIQIFPDL